MWKGVRIFQNFCFLPLGACAFGRFLGAGDRRAEEQEIEGRSWEFLGDLVALLILDCIEQSRAARQFRIGHLASFFREHSCPR